MQLFVGVECVRTFECVRPSKELVCIMRNNKFHALIVTTFSCINTILVLGPNKSIFNLVVEHERSVVNEILNFLRERGVKRLSSIPIGVKNFFNREVKVMEVDDGGLSSKAARSTPSTEPKRGGT
jgi:hypothetical protein